MPETVQLLTEDGVRVPSPQYDPFVTLIDDAALLEYFEDMTVLRRIDTEATALQRQGELALWPPSLGQEAAQIGAGRAMRDDDFAFTSYREHGVALCRGLPPVDLLPVWRGATASGWNPYEFGIATPQVIIGAQALHAAGYAMGIQNDGADAVAVAFFGDGAMSEGDVNEAFVFAAAFQAPVVFVCQNNQFAISEPVALQSHVPLAERSLGFGIPSIRVDGNDVLGVLAVMRAALDHARSGQGPMFVEAVTYRMGPHTTADDPTRYRDPAELEEWGARDPILRVRLLLEGRGVLDEAAHERVGAIADRVAREVRAGCVGLADPPPLSVFDNVYADAHTGLDAQRDDYARYLAGFAS